MKRIMMALSAGLIGLLHPTASNALVFKFSFSNTGGTVPGTVTGEIFGLVNGTAVPATNVVLDSYPAGLGLPSPPLNAFTGSIADNAFNVSSDQITRADFDIEAGSLFSFGMLTESPNNFLISGAGPNLAVRSDQFPSFTLVAVREPSSVALVATGFAALWLGWRRPRRTPFA
jgi:hypothetical protein